MPETQLPPNQRLLTEDIVVDYQKLVLADPMHPVITDCKIIGTNSQNRRRYTREAKMDACPLYENAPINLNHPQIPNSNRSVLDRFGWLEQVHMVGDDLYGNIHLNPKHEFAEAFIWWAQNNPKMIGLSHNAVGQGKEDPQGIFEVDKIVTVRSVDLVAEPATTKGLFEEVTPMETPPPATSSGMDNMVSKEDRNYKIGVLVQEICNDTSLDSATKRKKILQACGLLTDGQGATMESLEEAVKNYLGLKPATPAAAAAPPAVPATQPAATPPASVAKTGKELAESILADKRKKLEAAKKEIQAMESKDQAKAKAAQIAQILDREKLPEYLRSEVFMESLMRAKDEARILALIEERRIDAGLRRPNRQAKKQPVQMTTEQFLEEVLR